MQRSLLYYVAIAFLGLLTIASSLAEAIEVHGHRGARGARPENTLPAFEYALEVGVDVLELDLAVTKDGVLVVSHEPLISPALCLGPGGTRVDKQLPIRMLTLAEVKAFDCGTLVNPAFPEQQPVPGTKIPTLDEVFEMVKSSNIPAAKNVRFNIETKLYPRYPQLSPSPEEFAALLLELIAKHELKSRLMVQSFDHRSLTAVKKIDANVKIALLTSSNLPDFSALIRTSGAEYIAPNLDWVTPEVVKAAQEEGAKVVPWTANTPEEWRYLIHCNVDGIITDRPKELIEFLKSKK